MNKTIISTFVALAMLFGTTGVALANPSTFNSATSTAAATTTVKYMRPGVATTTVPTFDAYSQTFAGSSYKADFAVLLIQFTASSTLSTLNGAFEYSADGIDWYRNFLIDPNQVATSTGSTFGLVNPFSFQMKFASSTTIGGVAYTNANMTTAALLVPTPLRYTRIVLSEIGANGAVWASLLPIRQTR